MKRMRRPPEQLFVEPSGQLGVLPLPRAVAHRRLGRVPRFGAASTSGWSAPLLRLEADLAGVEDGDFCHRVIHERELPVVRG
jgi:hypothetical protein